MARKKNRFRYSSDIGKKFFDLCKEGYTFTQIATQLEIPKRKFLDWLADERNYEFKAIWEQGTEMCQAYHETKLRELVHSNASGPVITGQQYILKTLFPKDWADKNPVQKVEVMGVDKLSNEELDAAISRKLKSTTIIKALLSKPENDLTALHAETAKEENREAGQEDQQITH